MFRAEPPDSLQLIRLMKQFLALMLRSDESAAHGHLILPISMTTSAWSPAEAQSAPPSLTEISGKRKKKENSKSVGGPFSSLALCGCVAGRGQLQPSWFGRWIG